MSRPAIPASPSLPRSHPGVLACAAELSAELAAAWAGAPERWARLVRHVPGGRWYLPLPVDEVAVADPSVPVSAWLISWAPGSGLGLHDHGGSAGSLAVVRGELAERHTTTADVVVRGDGSARGRLRRRRLRPGTIATFAGDHVHEVRNDGLEPAVSIHVYVPGLREMSFYDGPAAERPGIHTSAADPREDA
jgi:hypothetical protein